MLFGDELLVRACWPLEDRWRSVLSWPLFIVWAAVRRFVAMLSFFATTMTNKSSSDLRQSVCRVQFVGFSRDCGRAPILSASLSKSHGLK